MMNIRYLVACLGVASVVLVDAVGGAGAADEWFVIAEDTLKSANPSVEIKGEEGKLFGLWKEDIKQTKLSVDGADVEIQKVVLHWNNRPDDTIHNVGVVKSGGETAPKEAPGGIEAALLSVAVQYKILGDAETANLKVWGFD
jgi:hypothetical protein